ncbi:MAG: DNA adenine methylase [Treponema sp.]|nr:DNA adenine methylase [Treponema sp.]
MEETPEYLSSQIITYIGNKRQLLANIEAEVLTVHKELGKEKLVCADIFSGSGIVARMLKGHSDQLTVNDLEEYSQVLNSCYLANRADFPEERWQACLSAMEQELGNGLVPGILTAHYAPGDDRNIKRGERVFYTHENALLIDSWRDLIDRHADGELKKFFLAPLLTEASVHVNTSGVFKGFYKDKETGIGCFGGSGKNALPRILGKVQMKKPVLSAFSSTVHIHREDSLSLAPRLKDLDLAYLDPPYNQHPYGSNYFMLNLIVRNKLDSPVSEVSGIPQGWNRSAFNRSKDALPSLEALVGLLDAKYLIVSYNSEGFISLEQMTDMLSRFGKLKTVEIPYPTFRGSRNLAARSLRVREYLFVLQKS